MRLSSSRRPGNATISETDHSDIAAGQGNDPQVAQDRHVVVLENLQVYTSLQGPKFDGNFPKILALKLHWRHETRD